MVWRSTTFGLQELVLTLHQYVFMFIICFISFWVKLDKFTMVKVGNLS
jgi:hypothetical protein